MMRSAVDLPQPDGPSRVTNSPCSTSIDMFWSATVPFANAFDTPRSETSRARSPGCRELSGLAGSTVGPGAVMFMSARGYADDEAARRCAAPPRQNGSSLLLQFHADLLADELGR